MQNTPVLRVLYKLLLISGLYVTELPGWQHGRPYWSICQCHFAERARTYRHEGTFFSPRWQRRIGEKALSFRREGDQPSPIEVFHLDFSPFPPQNSVKILTTFCSYFSAHPIPPVVLVLSFLIKTRETLCAS